MIGQCLDKADGIIITLFSSVTTIPRVHMAQGFSPSWISVRNRRLSVLPVQHCMRSQKWGNDCLHLEICFTIKRIHGIMNTS